MKTELLHKYFRGETTEKEENQIVEWVESSVENKEHFLKERMLFDVTLFSDGSNMTTETERASVPVPTDCHCRHAGYCFCNGFATYA